MSFLCNKYNVDKKKAPSQKVPSSFDQFLTVFKVTEFFACDFHFSRECFESEFLYLHCLHSFSRNNVKKKKQLGFFFGFTILFVKPKQKTTKSAVNYLLSHYSVPFNIINSNSITI